MKAQIIVGRIYGKLTTFRRWSAVASLNWGQFCHFILLQSLIFLWQVIAVIRLHETTFQVPLVFIIVQPS